MFENFVRYHVKIWVRDCKRTTKDRFRIITKIFDDRNEAFRFCTEVEKTKDISQFPDAERCELLEVIGIFHHEVFDKLIYEPMKESGNEKLFKGLLAERVNPQPHCTKSAPNLPKIRRGRVY